MAWNDESKIQNPIEGALGKFIAIAISIVSLIVSQTKLPLWVVVVLAAIVLMSAIMMLRSPFSLFWDRFRTKRLRRRMKALYLPQLERLSSIIERVLKDSHGTSFANFLNGVRSSGVTPPHATIVEMEEFHAISNWNQSLQVGIRYCTTQSFEPLLQCHGALIQQYISLTRRIHIRMQQLLSDPNGLPQHKEYIRRQWEECRVHGNELINSWRRFRMDYESSLGRNDDIYYELIQSL